MKKLIAITTVFLSIHSFSLLLDADAQVAAQVPAVIKTAIQIVSQPSRFKAFANLALTTPVANGLTYNAFRMEWEINKTFQEKAFREVYRKHNDQLRNLLYGGMNTDDLQQLHQEALKPLVAPTALEIFKSIDYLPKYRNKVKKASSDDIITIRERDLASQEDLSTLHSTNGFLCLLNDNSNLDYVSRLLETQIGTPQIIAILPNTEEGLRNIYGNLPNKLVEAALKQFRRVSDKLQILADVEVINEVHPTTAISETIKNEFQSNNQNLVIILGHNENGKLKFSDGSDILVEDLYNLHEYIVNPRLVLSCETVRYASSTAKGIYTKRQLEYDEVTSALRILQFKIRESDENITYGRYIRLIEKALNHYHNSTKRKVKLIVSSIGGSLIIYVIIREN